jgi:hypothetical protein
MKKQNHMKFPLSLSLVQPLFLLNQLPLQLSWPSNPAIASDICGLPSLPQPIQSAAKAAAAMILCKSFPQAYADRRFYHQIKTCLISPSPTTKKQ